MQHYSKILSVICAGLMTCAVTATAATDESVTTSGAVLQTRQTVQVRGVVTDSNGMPVIGATVMEEGTSNNGTLTRSDGSFDLTVSRGASLKEFDSLIDNYLVM